jgi:hypothetical protein
VANNSENKRQSVTVRLDRVTLEKAKMIAVQRSTSLSELVARRIEIIFSEEESYESSERQARKMLARGFHLSGVRVGRGELHGR